MGAYSDNLRRWRQLIERPGGGHPVGAEEGRPDHRFGAGYFWRHRGPLRRCGEIQPPPEGNIRRRLSVQINQDLITSILVGVIISLPSFSLTLPVTVTFSELPPHIGSCAALLTSFCFR